MTPAELRAALAELGVTDGQLAKLLCLGENGDRTVRRWKQDPGMNGHRTIPGPAQVAIRLLIEKCRREAGKAR